MKFDALTRIFIVNKAEMCPTSSLKCDVIIKRNTSVLSQNTLVEMNRMTYKVARNSKCVRQCENETQLDTLELSNVTHIYFY